MHQPVMLGEVISSLNLKPGYRALDATVGGGGHAVEILKRIGPGGLLIGIDADASAVNIARERLAEFGPSLRVVHGNFRDLDAALLKEGLKEIDAALFDVGVSSFQLDDASRGFGLKRDSRLDMRMDTRIKISAYEIVNTYAEGELSDIFAKFGEERFHKRIARRIVEDRAKVPVETTFQLKDIICRAMGSRRAFTKIDPATRTFQALRIAVNDELQALQDGIKQAISWLRPGGRISVISFHSLEDRIVKRLFKGYASLGMVAVVTKRPLQAADEEVKANPRARSARLRVAERL